MGPRESQDVPYHQTFTLEEKEIDVLITIIIHNFIKSLIILLGFKRIHLQLGTYKKHGVLPIPETTEGRPTIQMIRRAGGRLLFLLIGTIVTLPRLWPSIHVVVFSTHCRVLLSSTCVQVGILERHNPPYAHLITNRGLQVCQVSQNEWFMMHVGLQDF